MQALRGLWPSLRAVRFSAWAMVVLSAFLQVSSFPVIGPLPYWRSSLCWVALVPLLAALSTKDKNDRNLSWLSCFTLAYTCGILTYLGNCYWIYQTMYLYGGLPKPVSLSILILFAFYLGLYHASFGLLLSCAKRLGLLPSLALSPFLWVMVELARARVTAVPWDLLGYSQVSNLVLTRLAPMLGVMGLSFVIAAVNAGVAAGLLGTGQLRTGQLRTGQLRTGKLRTGKLQIGIGGAALLLALCLQVAGALYAPPVAATTSVVTLLQENLAVGTQRREAGALTEAGEIAAFSASSLHPELPVPAAGDRTVWQTASTVQSDLIVWPEAPSLMRWDSPYFLIKMGELARQSGTTVIAGSIGFEQDRKAPRGFSSYDSASFFLNDGSYRGRYDKVHLVPWGEYVPYQQFFSFAANLTEDVGDISRGSTRVGLKTGGHHYGVFICYESVFGDEIREFVRNGADVLVNISDDGWYEGTGAPFQHLDMTRMRAIENDRFVLQSTNTGVTTVIDPYGRTPYQAPRRVRGAFAIPFGFRNDLTFYTRHGDWFAWLCTLVALSGLLWSFSRKPARALK